MMIARTSFGSFLATLLFVLTLSSTTVEARELPGYLTGGDQDAFAWEVEKTVRLSGAKVTYIRLTSQRWQGMEWKHWLTIVEPDEVVDPDRALLLIAGGSQRANVPSKPKREILLLSEIAKDTGTIMAVLTQVPNQPLFGRLKEDALIAYTFKKWLETGDNSWPALLPMTKSAIRAMDAVQAYTEKTRGQAVEKFFVTGASKRGWTTWLTGAADDRVFAIAPMVIDILNMKKQLPHQVKMLGTYSEQIHDYTRLGLPQKVAESKADELLSIVDPWTYREHLTMPKLIVLGTNDRYWAVDAVKLYFDDLPSGKYIHYVPNAGHGLGPSAVQAIRAFYETLLQGEKPPRFTWNLEGRRLKVKTTDQPVKVHLWTAQSKDTDFRDDQWTAVEVKPSSPIYNADIPAPKEGHIAAYVALTYESPSGKRYQLCTNIEVLGPKKEKKGKWF